MGSSICYQRQIHFSILEIRQPTQFLNMIYIKQVKSEDECIEKEESPLVLEKQTETTDQRMIYTAQQSEELEANQWIKKNFEQPIVQTENIFLDVSVIKEKSPQKTEKSINSIPSNEEVHKSILKNNKNVRKGSRDSIGEDQKSNLSVVSQKKYVSQKLKEVKMVNLLLIIYKQFMKFIQKFSIFLNSTKFPNGPSALQYLQNLIIRKEEIDQQLLIQQLKENKNKIIQSFRFDSYQLVKFVKCAQLVTKQQLEDYQQPLLNIINNKFPSKIFLLQCLQLNLECNIDDIKTIPNNNNSQLISACLNALVKNYWLDYKEATAVLHYLHNQKVLKLLLNCEWVKSYIIQSQEGLNNSNLKNLALLSRIYADIGPSYLIKIAETVEKINFDDDHNNNQLSYITLYYTLSILKNYSLLLKKISNKIILTKNMDQQSLMQLLIGVSQSKDKEFVKQLFQYLNIETLNEIDMGLYYLCGTYFNLIQKDKILNDISNQFLFTIIKRMKHKQIGELCINLWNKYEINIIHFFLNNQDLIDSSNIVNLYLIDKEKSLNLKIQIEQNLMQKNIDLPGMMKLSQLKEFQYILSEAIIQFNYEDIKYHIKELSSILLHIEPYINDLSQLLEMITQAIYEQHSRVIGFGNIIYIASKKNKKFIPAISNNIFSQMIKQCDAIELINLLKGLYNFNLLTKEDYDKIMLSIKQKTNEGNKQRVERNLSKLPKLIHSF